MFGNAGFCVNKMHSYLIFAEWFRFSQSYIYVSTTIKITNPITIITSFSIRNPYAFVNTFDKQNHQVQLKLNLVFSCISWAISSRIESSLIALVKERLPSYNRAKLAQQAASFQDSWWQPNFFDILDSFQYTWVNDKHAFQRERLVSCVAR